MGLRVWFARIMGDGRGNLRENRKDPPPTVGIAGRSLRGMPPTIICAHVGIKGNGERGATMRRCKNRGGSLGRGREGGSRRGAPRRYVLREPGESGLNRRIPKRDRGERPVGGQSFMVLPLLEGKEF